MPARMLGLLVLLTGLMGVMAIGAPSASAYVFSTETTAACPACVTADGESAAAEIASGLSINGPQSTTYGSTLHLVDDAKLLGPAAGDGTTDVAISLLRSSVWEAFGSSPFATGGLVVGAFATGYIIGTAGRALYLHFFGGSQPGYGSSSVAGDVPWANARWVLCTDRPTCVTTVYSSAWQSPVIRTGDLFARFDSTWQNQNFSVTGAWGYTDCYGSTPPASPCRPYYYGSSGPPAGALPGAQPITVYTMGLSSRPGYAFVQTLQQLLDRNQPNGVIDSSAPAGTYFGSVASATPPTRDEALGAIDDEIARNEDFGGFVESEIEAHWPTIPDCDHMTQAACEAAIHNAGFHGTITARTLTASEAVMARDPNKVTATSPSGLAKADPGTAITVYVNPATKPSLTLQQALIANAMKNNNPSVVTDENKADIARACEQRVKATGSNRSAADCMTPGIPIYVIGREWPQAADHTIQGLEHRPRWVLLNYMQQTRTTPPWYDGTKETGSNTVCKGKYRQPNPAATACDEWPWLQTQEGGGGHPITEQPHLKIINALQNSTSGRRYQTFFGVCHLPQLQAAIPGGGRFLVIPLSRWMPQSTPSLDICNGAPAAP